MMSWTRLLYVKMDEVLDRIHSVPFANHSRNEATKLDVVCCGLPRTGTQSLSRAIALLQGGVVYHGSMLPTRPEDCVTWIQIQDAKSRGDRSGLTAASFDRLLGDCSAVADMPGAAFAPELLLAYPDAKFILNTRNVDDWFNSMRSALGFYLKGRQYFELFDSKAYWMRRFIETISEPILGQDFVSNGKQAYQNHCEHMKRLIPTEKLLEWSVEDGWDPLCKFLNKPIPDIPFPHGNSAAEIHLRLAARINALKRKAFWYVTGLFVVLVSITITFVGGSIGFDWRTWHAIA